MSITNFDGFNYINTILRKEVNGSSITPDRFNTSLNVKFTQKLDDEYAKFEINQKNTDSLRMLKKRQIINFDGNFRFDLNDFANDYWHLISASYSYDNQFIDVDVVTEREWNRRMSSSLEQPDYYYPILRVIDNYLNIYPYNFEQTGSNKVTNAGTDETTDWVDTNTDGVADNWSVDGGLSPTVVSGYGFNGNAQACNHSYSGFGDPLYSSMYSARFQYTGGGANLDSATKYLVFFKARSIIISDNGDGDMVVTIHAPTSNETLSVISDFDQALDVSWYSAVIEIGSDYNETFAIYSYNSVQNNYKYLAIDEVSVYEIGNITDVDIVYLKKANTPYFDWYYDANDNIQYLEEGEIYTLQANETYIDKDDGTVHISGAVIGVSTDDAINHTKEMEVSDEVREAVFYSMLSDFGVSLDNQLASQYSIGMYSKENLK